MRCQICGRFYSAKPETNPDPVKSGYFLACDRCHAKAKKLDLYCTFKNGKLIHWWEEKIRWPK